MIFRLFGLAIFLALLVCAGPFVSWSNAATCSAGQKLDFSFESAGTDLVPDDLARLRSSLSDSCSWILTVFSGDAPDGNIKRRRNKILAKKRIQTLKRLDFIRQKGSGIRFDFPRIARKKKRQGTMRAESFSASTAQCRSGGKTFKVSVQGEQIVESAALGGFIRSASQSSCIIRVNGYAILNTHAFRGAAHDEKRKLIVERISRTMSFLKSSGVNESLIKKGSARILNSRKAAAWSADYILLEIM